jgi:hypothetical protein
VIRYPPDGYAVLMDQEPHLIVFAVAILECGCLCFTAIRADNREVATAPYACEPEHHRLIEHFNLLLRESLVEPTSRKLIDVVDELLMEAERNWRG